MHVADGGIFVSLNSKIGFMCIRVYKRNDHIVELEASNHLAKDQVDACSQQHYQNYLSITSKYRLLTNHSSIGRASWPTI